MAATAKPLKGVEPVAVEDPHEHLLLDPRPREEMNSMVMESMHTTTWKYWLTGVFLGIIVLTCLFYVWGYMTAEGLGTTGLNRPTFWAIFLVNVVYWIGLAHAGTFVSALLRAVKAEFRRPFTRVAELITLFALINVGFSVFMHMGRSWLAYWLAPYPNERTIWPNFHSPLGWDFLAISTYTICSTLYLYMPLIPDLAMARDRSTGWRRVFYRILAVGFRGTEGEWEHLHRAMTINAWAFIPLMFSVSTTIAWDFAAATRPEWWSTIFGPYFVAAAVHSGIGLVAIFVVLLSVTMKNMKYFIRPEHFDAIGKLMLVMSVVWGYFFFNDYIIQWFGGDKFVSTTLAVHEKGPYGWMWIITIIFEAGIPWVTLWFKKVRTNPAALLIIGLLINVGKYFEDYVIVPVSLTINRMPFSWRYYFPRVEILLTIGTVALFSLLYMIATRIVPVIPVWEVQEGQTAHSLKRVGRATVKTLSEIE
jgi:Ni/Fe-hydrogenase subunit HybB-like protein